MSHLLIGRCLLGATAILLAGCSRTAESPVGPSMLPLAASALHARSSERCVNVSFEGAAALAVLEVTPGIFTLGALPAPVTLGAIAGRMSSTVTSFEATRSQGQGAQHLTLQHRFESTNPTRAGTFLTEATAVCAPAGPDPNVCRVSDVMQIASGTGIFANPDGVLHNHGVIDLNDFTITISLRGRICGDGL